MRLIQGEPGVGKTWFGCELAQYELSNPSLGVQRHKKILFLTFARNAVARIRQVFTQQTGLDEKKGAEFRVQVETFAGFFWWLVESYGRYTRGGTTKRLWLIGSRRVANALVPSGYAGCTFDELEEKSLQLIRIQAVRRLMSEIYPLVIVDEFQDVHDRLFDIIGALGEKSRLVLLRGPGQCIYRELPGRVFNPDAVLKKCREILSPSEFELSASEEKKQRYCREIKELISEFENGGISVKDAWPVRLVRVERNNRRNVPNNLEAFANRIAHEIKSYLAAKDAHGCTIALLASTNQGVGEIYRTIRKREGSYILDETSNKYEHVKGQSASVTFTDNVFLQYGRLMLQLLKTYWIARKKEGVTAEEVSVLLALLFQEQNRNSDGRPEVWKGLAQVLIGKVSRQRRPRSGSEWEVCLLKNISTLNYLLRATQQRLRREGISNCPSTAFDKGDSALLETLALEFIESIRNNVDTRGQLDATKATISFEKENRQKIIFEKLGLQKNVQVMTIHKSKGREFHGVVLVLEDNHKALWRNNGPGSDKEVEDLYRVAISRARSAFSLVAFEDARKEARDVVKRLLPAAIWKKRFGIDRL